MSFLDSFEELSLESISTDSTGLEKKNIKFAREKKDTLANRLKSCKSNPETFDYELILKQMKPKVLNTGSPEVVDRLMFGYQLSQNKKQFLRQKKECDEIKSCTFRPQIVTPTKKRTFQEFYSGQKQFLQNKNEKIEKIREKQIDKVKMMEVEQTKPVRISPGSRAIIEKRKVRESRDEEFKEVCKTVSMPKGYFRDFFKPPLSKVGKNIKAKKSNN